MPSESANGGFLETEKTLTIRIFGSYDEAGLAAANLQAHGIKCLVTADDCAGWYSNLTAATGIRLQVRAADAEEAVALLDAAATPSEADQLEVLALASPPPNAAPIKKIALGQIFIAFLAGIFFCLLFRGNSELGYKTKYAYTADGKCYEGLVYRDGQLTEVLKDDRLGGKWDARIYYEHGHVFRAVYDENYDGKPDEWVIYSNSSPVSSERDTDFNDIPDVFCSYSNGIIQQVDYRPNGIKHTTTREIYKNGVLTEVWRGGDSHGFFNEVEKYDPFFNEVEKKYLYFDPASTNETIPFQLLSPTSK
jgi:hypothetical protein